MGGLQKLVDLTLIEKTRTASAILVAESEEDDAKTAWLPLSQVEIEETGRKGIVEVTLPTWLAKEKGLV